MKQMIIAMAVFLFLSLNLVNAITIQEINEAKTIIDLKADCKSLSNPQLEILGEYYMEQMHPGESHELMHKMMGLKEGSKAEEQFHINMARTIYCGKSGGMMCSGGMMGVGGINMMGGSFGGCSWWLLSIIELLFWIALVLLIIWLYKKIAGQKTDAGSALEILKKRLAKGEITKKEFEERKKDFR